jgi:hypothetical protein
MNAGGDEKCTVIGSEKKFLKSVFMMIFSTSLVGKGGGAR